MRASPLLLAYGTNAPLVEAQLFNSIKSKVLAVGCRKLLLEKCALNESAKLKGGQKHGRFKTQWPQRLGFCRKKALNCEQQNKQVFLAGHKGMVGSALMRLLSTKLADQPTAESAFLTRTLEPTNEPYAVAKIAGIKLCESFNRQFGRDYRSVMPTNLYGPNDNFHLENSHVVPALIKKIHIAKKENKEFIEVWGSGSAKREFLYVDDMAKISISINNLSRIDYEKITGSSSSFINIGSGEEVDIFNLVKIISEVIGFQGSIKWLKNMPEGPSRKLLDTSKLNKLKLKSRITIKDGIRATYKWFTDNNV